MSCCGAEKFRNRESFEMPSMPKIAMPAMTTRNILIGVAVIAAVAFMLKNKKKVFNNRR